MWEQLAALGENVALLPQRSSVGLRPSGPRRRGPGRARDAGLKLSARQQRAQTVADEEGVAEEAPVGVAWRPVGVEGRSARTVRTVAIVACMVRALDIFFLHE